MSSSKLMMRPVILSSPEKLAFLLTIFCAGGSVTTSSPGCNVAGVCGTAFACCCRCPPGNAAAPGGAVATPGCGGVTATPGGAFCGTAAVPGGGASGCDCTLPGGGTPANGRLGAGNSRPRG